MCSITGVRDFPIDNRVTITQALYQKTPGSFLIDLQWAKRSVPPTIGAAGIFQEISSQQVTTLRFQSNTYKLIQTQICAPLHTSLLRDTLKAQVKAELIVTFKAQSSTIAEPYIYFCIPIVAGSTANPSAYLEALRTDRLPGRPLGYDSLIPEDRHFLSYTTCVQQVSNTQSTPIQVKVLLFVGCLTYPQEKITEILHNIPGFARATEFPQLSSLPDNVQPRTQSSRFLIGAESDFSNFLLYGLLPVGTSSESSTSEPGTRVDTTDAYKCIPLLPDQNVKDGKIIVDTENGELLSQVLDERKNDMNQVTPGQEGLTPADVERAIGITFGVALGIFVLSVLAYAITLGTTGNAGPAWPWLRSQFAGMTPYMFTILLVGTIGVLVGLGIGYAATAIPRK
jgi:tetrahydromethanopterin S-methyltransferase subunit G